VVLVVAVVMHKGKERWEGVRVMQRRLSAAVGSPKAIVVRAGPGACVKEQRELLSWRRR
jgi:hypothetical protein